MGCDLTALSVSPNVLDLSKLSNMNPAKAMALVMNSVLQAMIPGDRRESVRVNQISFSEFEPTTL